MDPFATVSILTEIFMQWLCLDLNTLFTATCLLACTELKTVPSLF